MCFVGDEIKKAVCKSSKQKVKFQVKVLIIEFIHTTFLSNPKTTVKGAFVL